MTKHVDIRQAGRTLAVEEGMTILEVAIAGGMKQPIHVYLGALRHDYALASRRTRSPRTCRIWMIGKSMSLSHHRWSKLQCKSVPNAGCDQNTCMQMCSIRPENY